MVYSSCNQPGLNKYDFEIIAALEYTLHWKCAARFTKSGKGGGGGGGGGT